MRLVPALALVASLAGPALAGPAAAPATARAMTSAARGQLAVDEVKRSLVAWKAPSARLDVRAAIVPFNGDPRNPITGEGPVEVYVSDRRLHEGGLVRRLLARMNPYTRQKYLVHVGAGGEAHILDRISLAPHRRLGRFLADKLPLRYLAVDFLRSGKATEGFFTAVGATGAAAVNPWVSGALYMRLAQVLKSGLESQTKLRRQALDDTVAWAKTTHTGSTQWPTLMETYRAYKSRLADLQEGGAQPLALGDFAEQLSIRQL